MGVGGGDGSHVAPLVGEGLRGGRGGRGGGRGERPPSRKS